MNQPPVTIELTGLRVSVDRLVYRKLSVDSSGKPHSFVYFISIHNDSDVTVTINRERADYIVILQHEGGKELFRRDNKFALFNKEGDMIESNSTRKLGNAVKEACSRIASSEARRRD